MQLDNWNKSKKADVLFDWADEKEYGIFNMHIANESALIFKDAKFTLPSSERHFSLDDFVRFIKSLSRIRINSLYKD